ncbi:hypothetical protein NEOLEDRAFT_381389 [Neolentinus lepideus HHB14362 ss-1]|uniref:Uncharacterized protein n=1 Tax=Neolentinus lepideus HHB14362 ss-1 TaxID=1314782 RepID=A0A165SCZ7_9AGAM|nr:hypothetical protein NEOLEDRAFT_381389 [Neolentinus lepideus HHB14362 ss-1]
MKRLHRLGITPLSYLPLSLYSQANEKVNIESVAYKIHSRKEAGGLAAGLSEQLNIQLSALLDDRTPNVNLILFSGYFTANSMALLYFFLEDGLDVPLLQRRTK